MKNVNIEQLRIPAYAVVNTEDGTCVELVYGRNSARLALKDYKTFNSKYKIAKLQPIKFIR